jgi:hypothetical protein
MTKIGHYLFNNCLYNVSMDGTNNIDNGELKEKDIADIPNYDPSLTESNLPYIATVDRQHLWKKEDMGLLLNPLKRKGVMIPSGIFLDLGTGSGVVPLEFAQTFAFQQPESRFIGVDIRPQPSSQPPIPDEFKNKLEYIWSKDAFEFLKGVHKDSVSYLTCLNLGEVIGHKYSHSNVPSNIAFLGYQAGRVLKPGGVICVNTGFSKEEAVELIQHSSGKLQTIYPLDDDIWKHHFFIKRA